MNKQRTVLQKGFTLAELMAVIIIISILAAMALGSYRKSLERAHFSDGLMMAHAYAAAVDMYYYDHNNTLPENLSSVAVSHSTGGGYFTPTYTNGNTYVTATRTGGNYQIRVYLESQANNPDECIGTDTAGKEFCELVGYKNCTDLTCRK